MQGSDTEHIKKLKKYYEEGYATGRRDAQTGIAMKLVRHTLQLRSVYMKEWEKGYIDGYLSVRNKPKTASSGDF